MFITHNTRIKRGKIAYISVTPRYAALITPQNAIRSEQFHVLTFKGSRSVPKWSDVLLIQGARGRLRLSSANYYYLNWQIVNGHDHEPLMTTEPRRWKLLLRIVMEYSRLYLGDTINMCNTIR